METILRSGFNTLGDDELIEACIGPTVRRVMGKSLTDKLRLTSVLTSGQHALLMFRILQGHSSEGVQALFYQLSYLFVHKGVWLEFKKGLNYFGDKALTRIADRLEAAYNAIATDGAAPGPTDVSSQALLAPLDKDLRAKMPTFVKCVAARIRQRPGDFICIVE
jgi:hypothetical protein